MSKLVPYQPPVLAVRQSVPAQRNQKKKKAKSRVMRPSIAPSALGHELHAFINPWSMERGKKIPDMDSSQSICARVRSVFTLGLNSDGTVGCGVILSRLNAETYRAPTYTAGTPTKLPITALGTGSSSDNYTALSTVALNYRVVAFGVRIVYVGPALNAQGWLTLSTFQTNSSGSLQGIAAHSTDLVTRKDIVPVQNGMSVTWFARPIDHTAYTYAALAGTATDEYRWEGLSIFAEGLLSGSGLFRVEVVKDIEWSPLPATIGDTIATPAASFDPIALAQISNAARATYTVNNATEGDLRGSSVWDGVKLGALRLGRRAVDAAVNQAGNYLLDFANSYAAPPRGRIVY